MYNGKCYNIGANETEGCFTKQCVVEPVRKYVFMDIIEGGDYYSISSLPVTPSLIVVSLSICLSVGDTSVFQIFIAYPLRYWLWRNLWICVDVTQIKLNFCLFDRLLFDLLPFAKKNLFSGLFSSLTFIAYIIFFILLTLMNKGM